VRLENAKTTADGAVKAYIRPQVPKNVLGTATDNTMGRISKTSFIAKNRIPKFPDLHFSKSP